MDEFLSQLDITPNANLDDLTKQFASILLFLQIEPHLEPTVDDVRLFLRAGLFLYGNLEMHGHKLEQKLRDCPRIPKNELNPILTKFHNGTLIDNVCEKLLMTTTGPNHIIEIQSFCNDFLDPHRYLAILRQAQDNRCSDRKVNENEIKAKYLIATTFQLKSPKDIDTAIKRLLDNINFDVLAWIINFNEPNTYLFLKCLVIQKETCAALDRGVVSENFIASMYEFSSQDDDGLSIFIRCLQNKAYANSLMGFCINYLTAIGNRSLEVEKQDIVKHDLLHVSFLIAAMLSSKSDCRIEFQRKLAEISVSVNVLLSISHLNFIYNF